MIDNNSLGNLKEGQMKEKIEKKFKNGPSGFPLMIFLFILVFLIGSGAGLGSGYYLGKKKAQKWAENQSQPKQSCEDVKGNKDQKAINQDLLPAEQTYTVQPGDTLFTVGLKFDMPWTKIAEANGLSEDSVIKVGDVLKIPSETPTASESKKFTINTEKMGQVQAQVDSGSLSWYLDPVLVAKEKIPPTYSITKNDQYSLKSKNNVEGIAIVEIIHNTKVYQVKLIQPVKKGTNGIWDVESVTRI